MRAWLAALLDLIYPPKCPVCRAAVAENGAWCQKCLGAVMAVRELSMTEHRLKYLDSCIAVCEYTGGIKRLLHDIKFRRLEKFARHLTWALEYGLSHTGRQFTGVDAVIPVPLHTDKMTERSYNQTTLIYQKWVERQGLSWLDTAVIRVRPTLPQWELNLAERRKNIKGAFKVTRPELIKGKHILLVDDIFTSGTTLDECAKQLKAAGAYKVTGLVLASGAR